MKSVVSYPERNDRYGNNKYRGNCSGEIIKDFINQYNMNYLSDYMIGGGTTEDVCKEMNVNGIWTDLRLGFNMLTDDIPDRPSNIFWHPPYHDIVVYSGNMYNSRHTENLYGYNPEEYDLSRCKSYEDFIKKLNYCMIKQFAALETGGHMGVLMGDIKKKGKLYSMLLDIAKPGTIENIVIKMQHNCFSDNTVYSNDKFIRIIHEYFLIIRKELPFMLDYVITKKQSLDIRDSENVLWKDVIAAVIRYYNRPVTLGDIYEQVKEYKKAKNNKNPEAKVRQILYEYKNVFEKTGDKWTLVNM
ncbi:MAG: hypothetical protein E7266_10565 [Lachnospiraceae bacterium]|nr:hypothetical protein [Lachnospiraceae bacterium]